MKPYLMVLFIGSIMALSALAAPTGLSRQSARAKWRFAPYLRVLLLVPCVLFFGAAAQAQDLELGSSLLCNTEKQVERFIALYDGDTRAAISAVNTEVHDPTACSVVTTAYVRGPQLATARNKGTTFSIVQVLVVGVADDEGSVESVTPAVFYSLVPVDDIEV